MFPNRPWIMFPEPKSNVGHMIEFHLSEEDKEKRQAEEINSDWSQWRGLPTEWLVALDQAQERLGCGDKSRGLNWARFSLNSGYAPAMGKLLKDICTSSPGLLDQLTAEMKTANGDLSKTSLWFELPPFRMVEAGFGSYFTMDRQVFSSDLPRFLSKPLKIKNAVLEGYGSTIHGLSGLSDQTTSLADSPFDKWLVATGNSGVYGLNSLALLFHAVHGVCVDVPNLHQYLCGAITFKKKLSMSFRKGGSKSEQQMNYDSHTPLVTHIGIEELTKELLEQNTEQLNVFGIHQDKYSSRRNTYASVYAQIASEWRNLFGDFVRPVWGRYSYTTKNLCSVYGGNHPYSENTYGIFESVTPHRTGIRLVMECSLNTHL